MKYVSVKKGVMLEMRKLPIKCGHGHRLFDAVDGSKLCIKMKCGNKKVCPHKANCLKQTEILFGGSKEDFCSQYRHMACPECDKRLFDATKDSLGIVQIKCDHCGKVVDISLGMSA